MKNSLLALATATAVSMGAASTPVAAQEYWVGQIIPVGFNFCPRSTANADGQLLPIASNEALFSLYGTTYGGDGRTTFALPDLRGRVPIHTGTGPGLPTYREGARGGSTQQTQTVATMAAHSHAVSNAVTATLRASNTAANTDTPTGAALADSTAPIYTGRPVGVDLQAGSVAVTVDSTIGNTGGNQPFSILDPYLTIRYCVVLFGIYPSRN